MASIDGKWVSNLGSTMDIRVVDGTITGTYTTTIGSTQGTYELLGRTDVGECDHPDGTLGSIGFVVGWMHADGNENDNDHGVTTWTGQIQRIKGEIRIEAMWVYVQETEPSENWDSTLVGWNVFTREG